MLLGVRTVTAALSLAALVAPAVSRAVVCPSDLAGSCWIIGGTTINAVGSAAAGDRTVRCSLRCLAAGGVLFLGDDGTYAAPAGAGVAATSCPSDATVAFPNDEGFVRRRRAKHILEPGTVAAFEAALGACIGRDLVIRRYRTTLRIAPDGTTLAGVTRLRYVIPGRAPVTTRVAARFTALRAESPTRASARSREPRALPPCSTELEPRCVTD